MSNFTDLEIITFTPYIKIDKTVTFDELQQHIKQGERYISRDDLDLIENDDILTGNFDAGHGAYGDELECIESWASDNNLIDSERMLSERFDDLINTIQEDSEDRGASLPLDDTCAMREWFSSHTDSLQRDGELHREQVSQYDYCGKHDF